MFINQKYRRNVQYMLYHPTQMAYDTFVSRYGYSHWGFAIHTTPPPESSHFANGNVVHSQVLPVDRTPSKLVNPSDPASYRIDGVQTDLLSPLDLRDENYLTILENAFPRMTPVSDFHTSCYWDTWSQNILQWTADSNTEYDLLIDVSRFNRGQPLLGRVAGETYRWFSFTLYGNNSNYNHYYGSRRYGTVNYKTPWYEQYTSGNKRLFRSWSGRGFQMGFMIWGTVSDRNGAGDLKMNSIISDTVNPIVFTEDIKLRISNVL